MCLRRRQLDPQSRHILSVGYVCLIASFVLMNFSDSLGHRHATFFLGLRVLLLGCAVGLMAWSARRNGGCASRF
jgi:uncharacterized membrane protein